MEHQNSTLSASTNTETGNANTHTHTHTHTHTDTHITMADKYNLMEISFQQIEHIEEKEEGQYVGMLYGLPICIRYMGEDSEQLQALISDLSKYSHPGMAITYGVTAEITGTVQKIFLVRELVLGLSFYSIQQMKYKDSISIHNRLAVIFKLVSVFQFLHSFEQYYYFLTPNKIIILKDITVKLIDFIKDNEDLYAKIQRTPLNDEMRFIHPLLLSTDLTFTQAIEKKSNKSCFDIYSIGCMLFYAVFEELPWNNCSTKEDIIASSNENSSFVKEKHIIDREDIKKIVEKCFKEEYQTIDDLREDMCKIEEIKVYLQDEYVEIDYEQECEQLTENIQQLVEKIGEIIAKENPPEERQHSYSVRKKFGEYLDYSSNMAKK